MFSLKQEGLADVINKSRSSVASYENGSKQVPREVFDLIKEAFPKAPDPPNEEPNVIAIHPDDQTRTDRDMVSGQTVAIPLWRGVFGSGEEEVSFIESESPEFVELDAFYLRGGTLNEFVMCVVAGRSMAPRIDQAERFLVRLNPDVPADHLVVARSSSEANFVKVLRRSGHRDLELHSVNGEFKPIRSLDGWIIRGGVVMIRHNYEPGKPNIEWDEGRWLRG
jgi:hypothetical protein